MSDGWTTYGPRLCDAFIGGAFAEGGTGRFLTVNPATAEPLASVAEAGAPEVDAAVAAAGQALAGSWGAMEHRARIELLRRIARLIRERREELAWVEMLDTGKPLWDTTGGVERAADRFEFYAALLEAATTDAYSTQGRFLTYGMRQPLGVVAAITPWNFPLPMAALKLAPALAAGNAVILKPAEQAPLSALLLAEVVRDAGVPPGAVSVLPGGPEAGRLLVEHPDVAGITFTGSTSVGTTIAASAAKRLARTVLELGGKSPIILFPDAEVSQAIPNILFMFSYNQGQVCTAGTRLLVHRSIAHDVVARLVDAASRLRVGDPRDPRTQIGAVISEAQLNRIDGYVSRGRAGGGTLLLGGTRLAPSGLNGWFYAPTLFADVDPDSEIAQGEIFGPVLTIAAFDSTDDAIALANRSAYGLSAAVWTTDLTTAHSVAEGLATGLVFINTMNDGRTNAVPVEGWKMSGTGLENGLMGLHALTRHKSVIVNLSGESPTYS